MKINDSFKLFLIFLFFVFMLKNNVAMELAVGIFQKIKNKTPILAAPSMQLSFEKYNNFLTLYLGQQLFNIPKIKSFTEERKALITVLGLGLTLKTGAAISINNNFENYFVQNIKDKKYINLSTNILWYFFSTYGFFLQSERFKKIINSKKYLFLFDEKIKKFVPFFNLMYPFATLIENEYFERKELKEREKREDMQERNETKKTESTGKEVRAAQKRLRDLLKKSKNDKEK